MAWRHMGNGTGKSANDYLRGERSRQSASYRQCPACKRKGALSEQRTVLDGWTYWTCRWQDCQWYGDTAELSAARRAKQQRHGQ